MTPVVLITGAARRVGCATALKFADNGFNVAVHYNHSETDALAVVDAVARLGREAWAVRGDLAEPAAPEAIVAEALKHAGRIDVLVNNAAVFDPMRIDDFDERRWNEVLQINLTAVAAMCHHVWPAFQQQQGGAIVNLSDVAAEKPYPGYLACCASKGGVATLTRSLAKALAPLVRVNAVALGVAGPFLDGIGEKARKDVLGRVPLGRCGTFEEVADAVYFLAVDAAYMTGQILNVDGGLSM